MDTLIAPEGPDPPCRLHEGGAPHIPALVLNARGDIQCLTMAARHALEYQPSQRIKPLFLSHVHRHDLYRVMRDMVEIVLYGRAKARWLLRLQTGKGRWRWYRASVQSRLNQADGALIVLLKAL